MNKFESPAGDTTGGSSNHTEIPEVANENTSAVSHDQTQLKDSQEKDQIESAAQDDKIRESVGLPKIEVPIPKEGPLKIKIPGGTKLEEAVNILLEFHERGDSVFCDFNGHELFSDDVTMDSAFLEVMGKSKADYDKALEEARANERSETE